MPDKKQWLVVHQGSDPRRPVITYVSTDTGETVSRKTGDIVTDLDPKSWLITDGLVVPLHAKDDPKDVLAAHAPAPTDTVQIVAGQPIPDLIIVVPDPLTDPEPPADKESKQ